MATKEFILLALKAKTSPDFSLNDLMEEGRMDTVCRTVSNALWISNDLRRDSIIHVCLMGPKDPPKMITFFGSELKGMNPDELTIAKKIKDALGAGMNLKLDESIKVSDGVTVSKKAFETIVKEKYEEGKQLIYLNMKGKDIRGFKFSDNPVFILGDYIGLPKNTEKLIKRLEAEKMNLGPKMLFASHCPIIIHNELDRREN